MGVRDVFSGILPSIDELAEVMEPETKEALAPITTSLDAPEIDVPKRKETTVIKDERGVEIVAPEQSFDIVGVSRENGVIKVEIDFVNRVFAKALRWLCNIGLAVIIISAVLYFAGLGPSDLNLEVANWNKPAVEFWENVKGSTANGYSWFLASPMDPESDVVIGITLLALAPLVGFLLAIPGTKGTLRLLLLIISVEFIYAIIRPLIMHVAGH